MYTHRKRLKEIRDLLDSSYFIQNDSNSEMSTNPKTPQNKSSNSGFYDKITGLFGKSIDKNPALNTNQNSSEDQQRDAKKKSTSSLLLAVDGTSLEAIWSDNAVKVSKQLHLLSVTAPLSITDQHSV